MDKLVTIAKFLNEAEANIARSSLEAHDIQSVVVGGETASTLSYYGPAVNTVKLQVHSDNERVATKILGLVQSKAASITGDWICPGCGSDVDAGFEVCWSCGAIFDPTAQSNQHAPETSRESKQEDTEFTGDAEALRAWRSAVLSIGLPPFAIYAIYLLLRHAGKPLSTRGNRHFIGALLVMILVAIGYGGFIYALQ